MDSGVGLHGIEMIGGSVNGKQKITLWVGLFNCIFLLLFPPFDSISRASSDTLVFAGFNFVFAYDVNEVINTDVLFLEMVVLLVNVGVVWLLFRDEVKAVKKGRFNIQNAILVGVALNLMLILLFPPFEDVVVFSGSGNVPTFQGFHFIFSSGHMLSIITSVLYEEVVFVIFNGAILWLFFRPEKAKELSRLETMELMRKISGKK